MKGTTAFMLFASLLLTAPVMAKEDVAAARLHYKNGTRLYDNGQYREAAKEYELAFENMERAEFLFNVAQAYRLAEDYPAALRFYRSFLQRDPNATNKGEVEARIAEVEKAIEQRREAKEPPPQTAPLVLSPGRTPETAGPVVAPPVVVYTAAPRREPTPVYRRAWFWVVIGGAAVAVALGVGLGVGLSQSGTSWANPSTTLGAIRW